MLVYWLYKQMFGGGGVFDLGLFWASCSEYGLWWSQMDIMSLETDYMTPKTPDNMYHT